LARQQDSSLLQFRCHIGHVLTAETMLAAHFDVLETKLAACLMALNERAELCRELSKAARAQGQDCGHTKLRAPRRSSARRSSRTCWKVNGLKRSGPTHKKARASLSGHGPSSGEKELCSGGAYRLSGERIAGCGNK
jgi:hypothetical protein